jgi:alpha,alpha-trehalase
MELAGNFIAQAESGWDFNARLGVRGQYFMSPDLNSLLWAFESNMAHFATILANGDAEEWTAKATLRGQRMSELLWQEEDGFFADVDAQTGEIGPVFSMASLYPLFVGMATPTQAARIREKLSLLEHPHGICPCAKHTVEGRFQWDAPNVWPCLQWIAYQAMKHYGYLEDAERIAAKYVALVESVEEQTGQLWEKYNADSGNCDVAAEYVMPPMMGWTAGVYLRFLSR